MATLGRRDVLTELLAVLDTPAYHAIGPADRPVTSDDPVSLKDLPGPETYTVLEVAARLGIGRCMAYDLVRQGIIGVLPILLTPV